MWHNSLVNISERSIHFCSDFEIFTRARNEFKEGVRDSKIQYPRENKQKLVASRNDPKSFWKTIKQST